MSVLFILLFPYLSQSPLIKLKYVWDGHKVQMSDLRKIYRILVTIPAVTALNNCKWNYKSYNYSLLQIMK